MGLGKTLQVIALIHTVLTNQKLTKVKIVLILLPVNVMINWMNEFDNWTRDCQGAKLSVMMVSSSETGDEKINKLKKWHETGGVFLISYEMFTSLVYNKVESKQYLLDPGADLSVFDEGNRLKSKNIYKILTAELRTPRRIALTGKVIKLFTINFALTRLEYHLSDLYI